MTRKEQREHAAHNYSLHFPKDYVKENDYIAGAEWADKTIVDNICEWLNNNLTEENYLEFDEDGFPSINKKSIINDIRKIKEEIQ